MLNFHVTREDICHFVVRMLKEFIAEGAIGPIRAIMLLGILLTSYRFRTKRQLAGAILREDEETEVFPEPSMRRFWPTS